jgi:hypothetical protein
MELFRAEGWEFATLPAQERERLTLASRALDKELPPSAQATLKKILAQPAHVASRLESPVSGR